MNFARQQIENRFGERRHDDRVNLDQDYRGADLSILKDVRWASRVDFSGDFSGASFVGADFPPKRHLFVEATDGAKPPLILSGKFVRADFRGAVLRCLHLSGDFRNANFQGARISNCVLAGTFDGADLAASFTACRTKSQATFIESELESAIGLECSQGQVARARLGQHPQVFIRDGRAIQIEGRECPIVALVKPSNITGGSISRVLQADNAHFGRHYRVVEASGMTLEIKGHTTEQLVLGLKAEDVNLAKLTVESLKLVGNYLRVVMSDSPDVISLRLANGTFESLDLSQTNLQRLEIELGTVELGRVNLPASLRSTVAYVSGYEPFQQFIKLEKMSLSEIEAALEAWSSPTKRLATARRLFAVVPRVSAQRKQQWLNSRASIISAVLNRKSDVHGPLAMAALLVARENRSKQLAAVTTTKPAS